MQKKEIRKEGERTMHEHENEADRRAPPHSRRVIRPAARTERESYLFIANDEKFDFSPGHRNGCWKNHERIARSGEAAGFVVGAIRRWQNTSELAVVMAGVGHATRAHTCALKSSRRKSKAHDFARIPDAAGTRNARDYPRGARFRDNPAPG